MTPGFTEELDLRGQNGDRRESASWSVQKLIGVVGGVIALVSLVFTAGVEWNKVSEVGARQDKFETTVQTDYVRKDVEKQEMGLVFSKLDEMNVRLADLQQRARP